MNPVYVADTHCGMGVFAVCGFCKGDKILRFRGPLMPLEALPVPYDATQDHYLQIDERLYIGPSGDDSTFVNHSCDPNAGIVIVGHDAWLVAVRAILPGEEIRFDYSTTMTKDPWEMECACGSMACRRVVRAFEYLPLEIQERYVALGVVPSYVSNLR